jgi:hypothetical protein
MPWGFHHCKFGLVSVTNLLGVSRNEVEVIGLAVLLDIDHITRFIITKISAARSDRTSAVPEVLVS